MEMIIIIIINIISVIRISLAAVCWAETLIRLVRRSVGGKTEDTGIIRGSGT